MKTKNILFGLMILFFSVNAAAYDETFNTFVGLGGHGTCAYSDLLHTFRCQQGNVYNMQFLLKYTGYTTLSLDLYTDTAGVYSLHCLNYTQGSAPVWINYSTFSMGNTERSTHTITVNTDTGYCSFISTSTHSLTLYLESSYITYTTKGRRNLTAGATEIYPFINRFYNNQITTVQVYGDAALIANSTNNTYFYYNLIRPDCSMAGEATFKFMNYNASKPQENQEYYQYVNIVGIPDLNISSYFPAEDSLIIDSVGKTQTFYFTPSVQDTAYKLTWSIDYAEVSRGGLTNNIYVFSPSKRGKYKITGFVYDENCNRGEGKTWTVYVAPYININGKCTAGGKPAAVNHVNYVMANDSSISAWGFTAADGSFYITNLPAGIYNVTINDANYLPFNTTVNISYPVFISNPALIEVQNNFELTPKNITGNSSIQIKTDNDCNEIYSDYLPNLTFSLFYYPDGASVGDGVLSIVDGQLISIDASKVLTLSFNNSASSLNMTLTAGTYNYQISKAGYYDLEKGAAYYSRTFIVDYFNANTAFYLDDTVYMVNSSCASTASVIINTWTYNSTSRVFLPAVVVKIYDNLGAFNQTVLTNSSGSVKVNLTAKYWTFTGSKTGYKTDSIKTYLIDGQEYNLYLYADATLRNVEGLVYDCGGSKAPLSDADISLSINNVTLYSTKSDTQGLFSLSNIPEAYYKITVSKYAYTNYTEEINLKSNYLNQICLSRDANICGFKVYVLNSDNETLSGIEVYAVKANDAGNEELGRESTNTEGYAFFYLPKRLNRDGVELPYNFRLDGYTDATARKGYYCKNGEIYKTINNADLIPFDEGGVLNFLESYGFGLLLIVLLLFITYICVQFLRGIFGK